MKKRFLVAGIGNIFFGDDGYGVEVVRELLLGSVPENAHVVDFGIRSFDLAYALMDGYEEVILIDAAFRGEPPGTVYLIQIETSQAGGTQPVDGHTINVTSVLQLVSAFGGVTGRLHLVGCEPDILETDQIGLSPRVQAAVPKGVAMVRELIAQFVGVSDVGQKDARYKDA
ncbi:MAG: hybD [Verrucomicrobiales bacterium]|nr:hybD [Verrucomicrobiales bacterium]